VNGWDGEAGIATASWAHPSWATPRHGARRHANRNRATLQPGGQPQGERPAERLDRVWPDTGPIRNRLVAANDSCWILRDDRNSRQTGCPIMLDMRWIFVDISPGIDPVVREERKGAAMRPLDLCLIPHARSGVPAVRLGSPLLDDYLRFVAGRCRPNTVLAAAYDLTVFFTVVGRDPEEVTPADVLAFVTAQRSGQATIGGVLRPVGDDGRVCRCGRCAAGCRACPGCTRSGTPAGTCRRIRCRVGCPHHGSGSDHTRGFRWCVPRARCRGS
jgi:hypothetical protein